MQMTVSVYKRIRMADGPVAVHENAHSHLQDGQASLMTHDCEQYLVIERPSVALAGPGPDGNMRLWVSGWAHTPAQDTAEHQEWAVSLIPSPTTN